MTDPPRSLPPRAFDLKDFLPYLLNMAAETSSLRFQRIYRERYKLLRTDWRVMFHLGRYGTMTAREICDRSRTHKTKVSRAVKALEALRYVQREKSATDRRHEMLALTPAGRAVFMDLCGTAGKYDAEISARFTAEENDILRRCLRDLADLSQ